MNETTREIAWIVLLAQIVGFAIGLVAVVRQRRKLHWFRFIMNVVLAVTLGGMLVYAAVIAWAINFINNSP